jgi:O-antigen/teichoic acid export membrane protein
MDIFQLILGSNFRQGLSVVPILLVAYLLLGIYYNLSAWYKLADKTLIGAWIAIGGAAITIVGNILLIQRFEVIGSAWAALGCYLFMCIASYFQGQKHFQIPYKVFRMIGWIVGAVLVYFAMEWLRGFYEDRIAIIFLVNTLLVAFFVFLILKVEHQMIKQVIGKVE